MSKRILFACRLYRTASRPRRAGIRGMTSSRSNPSTQQAMASPMPTVRGIVGEQGGELGGEAALIPRDHCADASWCESGTATEISM